MLMSPGLRKFVLTAHVSVCVGWIGALAGFLALAVTSLVSQDALTVRAAYVAMDTINRFVIVPAALLSLATGIVQTLGTPWGLIRHYWVLFKILIIATATFMLLLKTGPIGQMASIAAETALAPADMRGLRLSILGHAVGGLAVLIWAMALGMYKPKAATPHGKRQRDGGDARASSAAN
ncbi:hypothetical protein [Oceaniradius stylonematis]|uniref:hypothetical protein n=1 Tax=Oceaniradius stylonematis TaxID=2184161 RepID=UPI00273D3692|nr:hypothetical protein [Oceaniradius stylonematis]